MYDLTFALGPLVLGPAIRKQLFRLFPAWGGRWAFARFCRPDLSHLPETVRAKTEKSRRLLDGARQITVESGGEAVRGYEFTAGGDERRGRVLLVHGWTSEAVHLMAFVRPLVRQGFDVLLVDLPAHGRSGGTVNHAPKSARAILELIEAVGPVDHAIAHSFGSFPVCLIAEGGAPVHRGHDLKSLVLLAAPKAVLPLLDDLGASLELTSPAQSVLKKELEYLAERPIDEVNNSHLLNNYGGKLLVVQDTQDKFVDPQQSMTIGEGLAGRELMVTEGLGHNGVLGARAVIQRVTAFLAQ